MNTEIFKDYLIDLNQKIKKQSRKILLLLDNAPSHVVISYSAIEFLFLPKNTTALLQPLDMGIIKAFKSHYTNSLIETSF
jgi:hypothetical protein